MICLRNQSISRTGYPLESANTSSNACFHCATNSLPASELQLKSIPPSPITPRMLRKHCISFKSSLENPDDAQRPIVHTHKYERTCTRQSKRREAKLIKGARRQAQGQGTRNKRRVVLGRKRGNVNTHARCTAPNFNFTRQHWPSKSRSIYRQMCGPAQQT